MAIKYSCFISYPHYPPSSVVYNKFIEQFMKALDYSLDPYVREDIYWDINYLEKTTPDEELRQKLGQAICESASWILVIMPVYSRRYWCLREYMAIELIEKRRIQMLGNKYDKSVRMIFPFLFRIDLDNLPPKIKEMHYYDLTTDFYLSSLTISRKGITIIENIAKRIYDHYVNLQRIDNYETVDKCNEFILP